MDQQNWSKINLISTWIVSFFKSQEYGYIEGTCFTIEKNNSGSDTTTTYPKAFFQKKCHSMVDSRCCHTCLFITRIFYLIGRLIIMIDAFFPCFDLKRLCRMSSVCPFTNMFFNKPNRIYYTHQLSLCLVYNWVSFFKSKG